MLGTATHGAQSNATAAFIDLYTATGATDIRTQPYRLITLRNGSSILQRGQEPYFRNGIALQNNKFQFTTLADTTVAATNQLNQPGTVQDATVQSVNNTVDHGDGTKTVTVTVDAKEYATGKSQFDATSVLSLAGNTLHHQEVGLSGDGSGSSAANAIQTSESDIHIRKGDALSSGTVRQVRVVLTLATALAAPLAKGATVSMHNGDATGTLVADAAMGANSLTVLVASDAKPFDALGNLYSGAAPQMANGEETNSLGAVSSASTTLLIDSKDRAVGDKITRNGATEPLQLQTVSLDVRNTTEPAVNDAVEQGTASGVVKRILSNGTTRTLMILPNDDNDFASTGAVTIANKKHEFQQLTTNSAFFGDAAGAAISQGGVNALGSRSDGASMFVFNANAAFAAGASATATVAGNVDNSATIAVTDTAGLAQGMYLDVVSGRAPGIKINTVDADAGTITLSAALTLGDQETLSFVEGLRRDGNEAQHRIVLDMTAKSAEGFLAPAVGDEVSQGASTGTVEGVVGNEVTIAATGAFTDSDLLSINGTEQRFQQLTVADDSPMGNITDLTAVNSINDVTASLIEQGAAKGRLRSYAGGVMTVQILDNSTFVADEPLTFGGRTHRYATLRVTTSSILPSETGIVPGTTTAGDGTAAGRVQKVTDLGNNTTELVVEYTNAETFLANRTLELNGTLQAKQTIKITGATKPQFNQRVTQGAAEGIVMGVTDLVTEAYVTIQLSNGIPFVINQAIVVTLDDNGNTAEISAADVAQAQAVISATLLHAETGASAPTEVTANDGLTADVSGFYERILSVGDLTVAAPTASTSELAATAVASFESKPALREAQNTAVMDGDATIDSVHVPSKLIEPGFDVEIATDLAGQAFANGAFAAGASQDIGFRLKHGNYEYDVAAFRFRATVTAGEFSEAFYVNANTFSVPTLFLSQYWDTAVTDAPALKNAAFNTTTGSVVGGAVTSTKWQIFREATGSSFYEKATTDQIAAIQSRLGGNVQNYLPVMASDALAVKEVAGQVVKVHHRGADFEIQALDEANAYGTQPVDAGMAALVNSRNTAAGSPDLLRIGGADYSIAGASAAVVDGVLEITFAAGVDVTGVAADEKVDVAFQGANTRHARFELRKDGGDVTASMMGPYKVRAVEANWQASEASATEPYTEKVFLLYNDANDATSYVVSSVEVGLQVSNTDDSNNVSIVSNEAAQSAAVFREDAAKYDSESAGLPILFSSIQGGDDSYTFTMSITEVSNGGDDIFVATTASPAHYVSGASEPNKTIAASINIRDTATPSLASGPQEEYAITYDVLQSLVAHPGFTSQNAAVLAADNTATVTLLASYDSVVNLGEVHVWESGIAVNEVIKTVETTADINDLEMGDTDLKDKLIIESIPGAVQIRALVAWDKIDSGRAASDKEVRTIAYGLSSRDSTLYQYGTPRFITSVAGNRWYMNTTGMVAGKTLKGTVDGAEHTMTVGQTTDYLKDMVTVAGTTMTLDTINLLVAAGMTVSINGETRTVTAVAQNKIVTLDSALTNDVAQSTEATFEALGYVEVAAASVAAHAGRVVSILAAGDQANEEAIPIRKFGTNSVDVHVYRTAAFRLKDSATGLENEAGAKVPVRTVHYSETGPTDSLLRYVRDSNAGVSRVATTSNSAVTIAGDTINIAPSSIQLAAPTNYSTSHTVTITDKNEAAIAYLAGGQMDAGTGVEESSQSITINVLPDPSIASIAGNTTTIDVFDKFLNLDDAMFKIDMNYYSDAANQAAITLRNDQAQNTSEKTASISGDAAGTIELASPAPNVVDFASAVYSAPRTYGASMGFLKLLSHPNQFVSRESVLNKYQPMEEEVTYTMEIEEKIRTANIADITENLLLTTRTATQAVAVTRHYNPQIFQSLTNPTQVNFIGGGGDGRRITHLVPQSDKASWTFTEFTGKGLGTENTAEYNNQYNIEFADGNAYPAAHEILSNAGSDYPQLEIEDGDFGHIRNGSTLISKIGPDEDIPTNLTNDETKIKLTLTFKCNRLDGSTGTNTIVYSLSDKLTTKEHPHIKFNHRSQPKAKYVQFEDEALLKEQEDLPWLVYTASNLENNAPFADFTVTGATAATTTMGTNEAFATHAIGLDAGNNRLRIATTASGVVASSNATRTVLTMAAENADIVEGMTVVLGTGQDASQIVAYSGGAQGDQARFTITSDVEGQLETVALVSTGEFAGTLANLKASMEANANLASYTVTVSAADAITITRATTFETAELDFTGFGGSSPFNGLGVATATENETKTVTAVNGTAVTVDSALAADIDAPTAASFSKALPPSARPIFTRTCTSSAGWRDTTGRTGSRGTSTGFA